jgi:hypothetical protein
MNPTETSSVRQPASDQSILPARQLVKNGWKRYKEFFKKIWPLYILGVFGVSAALGYSNISRFTSFLANKSIPEFFVVTGIIFVVLLYLFLILSGIALFQAIAELYKGTFKGIKSSYSQALRLFWPFIVLYILFTTAQSGGFYFFLIPGIALQTYLVFSNFEFFIEGKKDMSALLGSWALVKNRWWEVFWTLILIGLIIMLPTFIVVAVVGIIGFILLISLSFNFFVLVFLSFLGFLVCLGFVMVISPLLVLTNFELYFNLKELNKNQAAPDTLLEQTRKKKIIALAILGIVVSFILALWTAMNPPNQGNFDSRSVDFGSRSSLSTTSQQIQSNY